jgi:cyanophycinase
MAPSRGKDTTERGFIVPIGGAEEKMRDADILSRFVSLCGGRRARIAVIPTASELDDTGIRYERLFRKMGARDTRVLDYNSRRECEDAKGIDFLTEASGAFLTGGNQLRLSTTLGGTKVAQTLRRRNANGLHVAGTSAGAAFIPEHMIAGGREGSTPSPDMVTLAPGLGLSNRIIIDQHFRERDRLGRLLTALAFNPFAVGLGLDEDTAAFIDPDDELEVVGSGGISVVDPSHLEFSSMDSSHRHEPVSLIGIQMHILVAGGRFDLTTRCASAG